MLGSETRLMRDLLTFFLQKKYTSFKLMIYSFGLSFLGAAWSEASLIAYAYAFE